MAENKKSDAKPSTRELDNNENDSSHRLLEQAALDLLRENGILAGLNLREVAARAGVNRGLVYHHFGSREDLLRSALARDVGERLDQIGDGLSLPFSARIRQLLRVMIQQQPKLQLAFLLMMDGNSKVKVAPLQEAWRESFQKDKSDGAIDSELDEDAMIALISAISYGYTMLRETLADELDINVVQLDWRLDELLATLLKKGVEQPPQKQG